MTLFDPGRGISIDDKNTPQPHAISLKFFFFNLARSEEMNISKLVNATHVFSNV